MVEIAFHQAYLFKRIIESLKGLVEDATFDCETHGIGLQAMDVSHVALIAVELPADAFANYRCNEPIALSFNIETLSKLLKNAGTNDELTIKCSRPGDTIEMQLTAPSQDRSTTFHIGPVDVHSEMVSVPDHHYRASLGFSSTALAQLVRGQSDINDSVSVRCIDGSISFSVADNAVEAVTTFLSDGASDTAQEEVVINVTEDCRVSYALRYLKAISAASALAPRVSLSFSPHFPLLVQYDLNEGGSVRFYLAPKVEEDEDSEGL
jgi:proliferating cell nuclear antigen